MGSAHKAVFVVAQQQEVAHAARLRIVGSQQQQASGTKY
jgi:hypothetical protein